MRSYNSTKTRKIHLNEKFHSLLTNFTGHVSDNVCNWRIKRRIYAYFFVFWLSCINILSKHARKPTRGMARLR